jgi:hypothetical protein
MGGQIQRPIHRCGAAIGSWFEMGQDPNQDSRARRGDHQRLSVSIHSWPSKRSCHAEKNHNDHEHEH